MLIYLNHKFLQNVNCLYKYFNLKEKCRIKEQMTKKLNKNLIRMNLIPSVLRTLLSLQSYGGVKNR